MATSDDISLIQDPKHQHPPRTSSNGSNSFDHPKNVLESSTNTAFAKEATVIPVRKSYKQSLAIFSGRKTDESYWKLLLRPFPLLFHPGILWAMLIQGTMIGWTVFIGIILAAIFLGPPLWWNEVQTGYAYTGAFIGALLGFAVAGGLADWSAKFMTRRNNGIYEPEFRILLVIPQFVFGVAGLYGFGITASRILEFNWFWPIFFFALEVMGMVIGAVASYAFSPRFFFGCIG